MKTRLYANYGTLDLSGSAVNRDEVSLLRCDNFIYNRQRGGFVKRKGSRLHAITGDIWGLGGYVKKGSSLKMPATETPIRFRRNGGTSYIEKGSYASTSWTAITQGAHTSFAIGAIASDAQIDTLYLLCAGRPAQIRDITSGAINRLGGPAPTAAPTVAASAGPGSPLGQFSWFYTFYDSVTGWESSPSPITDLLSLNNKNGELSAMQTTCAKEGVDKKRIYRTIHTGEQPHLHVIDISLAQTTYTDGALDDALGLPSDNWDSVGGLLLNDNNPPPTESYICAAHEGRFWIASETGLYYSKQYDGNLYRLEQFSEERKFNFNQIITGLAPYRTGGMFVFTPPGSGIHEIEGRSEQTFSQVTPYPSAGTNYHKSIASHGEFVTYWGSTGPRLINAGGLVTDYDKQVYNLFRPLLESSYDSNAFVWALWHDASRQFIYNLSFISVTAVYWFKTSNSTVHLWEVTSTGALAAWQV